MEISKLLKTSVGGYIPQENLEVIISSRGNVLSLANAESKVLMLTK